MIIFLFTIKGYTQNAHFRLRVSQDVGMPSIIGGDKTQGLVMQFSDTILNILFSNYTVYLFEKEFPTARTSRLQNVYEVISNDIELMYELINNFGSIYTYGNEIPEPMLSSYTPNDYSFALVQTNLDLIRAEEAWGITTGDPNIKIGITDTEFDLTHPDLSSQIISYSGVNGSSHGTSVAGCAAAATDNGVGISGIGFNCKLMVSTSWANYNQMLLLSQTGARVLNASWINRCSFDLVEQDVIDEIFENGTVVVAGAGNGLWPNGTPRSSCCTGGVGSADCGHQLAYPASYNHVISVSSVGHVAEYGYIDPIYGKHNWKDLHRPNADDLVDMHTHNVAVDICAPGYNVPTLKNPALNSGNLYGGAWGTSFSSPTIAGVCGLILSVNPCLQPHGVEDILKATAVNIDNIPENAPYAGKLGAGRVDAYEAVKAAQASYSATLDLYSKDTYNDFGVEPNMDNGPLWISEDIWVRMNNDGIQNQQTESIEYRAGQPVYVYVRVRNRSCQSSLGTETLTLNWAKASTGLSWPTDWDGSVVVAGQPYSSLVGNLTIPLIDAGNETILTFTWTPPNPDVFQAAFGTDYKHFCLLSRIQTSSTAPYGMTYPEGSNIYANTKNNNNIVWKNVQINNDIPGIVSPGGTGVGNGAVIVRNAETIPVKIKLGFQVPVKELGNSIFDKGTIKVNLGTDLFDKWNAGGRVGNGVALAYELRSPRELNQIIGGIEISVPVLVPILTITKPNAYIGNINLAGREEHTISMEFYQDIALPAEGKNQFNYDVVQYNTNGIEEITGGERYIINALVEQTVYGTTLRKANTTEQLTSIEDLSGNKIAIYPNPTSGEFTINLKNASTNGVGFALTTLEGKIIQQEQKVSSTTIVMDLSEQPKGIYLLKIEDAQSVNVYKIIRQ